MNSVILRMRDPLLTIGAGLLLLGLFIVFLVPSMGLLMFAIGGGLIFAHYKSPQGQKELKEAQKASEEARRASIEERKAFEANFERLRNDPSDNVSLQYILNALASQNKKSLKKSMRTIILPLLRLRPLDGVIRDTVFSYAKQVITIKIVGTDEASSGDIYKAALDILSQHPDQIPLKQYALEVGRWHYAIQRPDRKVTIYDEQAIQNDIAVRSK